MFYYSKTKSDNQSFVMDVRKRIYNQDGYFVFKNFIDAEKAESIARRWSSGRFDYEFHDRFANSEVRIGHPNYCYHRPGSPDLSYCMHMWNAPVDQALHSICLEAQSLRNLVEGRALHFGTQLHDPLILQYRLSRTLSTDTSVFPHADFLEEPRRDSMGDHAYDPRRCQMTLMLSDYGTHYKDGGFFLQNNQDKQLLLGRDVSAQIGDLVLWKYSNKHTVTGVVPMDQDLGFSRVIFPSFDKEYVDVSA